MAKKSKNNIFQRFAEGFKTGLKAGRGAIASALSKVGKMLQKASDSWGIDEEEEDEVSKVTDSVSGKMILLEPRAYSEAQQIADYLKANSAVVVNLKRVTPDQAKRIVDFLSGTLYAIEGNLQKLGGGIFLCAPGSIDVERTNISLLITSSVLFDSSQTFKY